MTRTEQCPNCDADCEEEDHDSEYSDSREENEEWWSFTCEECGCEFTVTETEKTTIETEVEVTKEGKPKKKAVFQFR